MIIWPFTIGMRLPDKNYIKESIEEIKYIQLIIIYEKSFELFELSCLGTTQPILQAFNFFLIC